VLLAAVGLLLASARRGAGIGLALVSALVCGSSFYVAYTLAGGVHTIARSVPVLDKLVNPPPEGEDATKP
jgi:hypothetical protein